MRYNKNFYGKYFKLFSYILKLFLILSLFVKDIKSTKVFKGNLPDPLTLSRIFNQFVGPIIKSFPAVKPVFRTVKENAVDKAIREKIAKLRSLLQDDDIRVLDDNILFNDKDETTIIEFLSKTEEESYKLNKDDIFKTNLKKYKKVREKINKALVKENVSDKTKDLIVKTVDDLIKKLIGSQCKWKRNLRAEGQEESAMIANRWNQGLDEVRNILSTLLKNESRRHEVPKFMENLQILFKTISKDVDIISKKYKIQCEFVPKYPSQSTINPNALRNNWGKNDEDDRCQKLFICSKELKEFLHNFYQALNDTSVSILKNYAEMYVRDVIPDNDNERGNIISLLNKSSGNIENNVTDIFIKETNKLELNKDKNKDANINILTNYIKDTIDNVKACIRVILKAELGLNIREKIRNIVSEDIKVNLDVDLGNLEQEFVTKICSVFRLCNGKYGGRRLLHGNKLNNTLYVQVELSLDDDINDVSDIRRILNMKNSKNVTENITEVINVTRTTHI